MQRSLAGNAAILVASGFAVRMLGFVYRVYLSNLLGAEGMGLYQLISPVYLLAVLTITSGISIAVSRLVSREQALEQEYNARRILWTSFFIGTALGTLAGLVMFLFPDFLSSAVISDPRARDALRILAFCVPVVCMTTALKGYFYGSQKMTPNAVAQMVEQGVRILTTGYLIQYLGGAGSGIPVSTACAYAMAGTVTGEMSSFLVVMGIYAFGRKRRSSPHSCSFTFGRRKAAYKVLGIAFPVSANRFVTSLMGTIETVMIPGRLQTGGLSINESMAAFGRFSGMSMPLIYFPAILTSALSTTLVPAIAEAVARGDLRRVNHRIDKSIRYTMATGILFSAFFLAFPHAIGNLAYPGENVGGSLQMLALCCVFMYLSQTLHGILNGLGRQNQLFWHALTGYGIRILAVWFLIPLRGMEAYAVSITISLGVTCILNLRRAARDTGLSFNVRDWLIKPLPAGIAVIGVRVLAGLLPFWGQMRLELAAAFVAIGFGIACLFAFGVIRRGRDFH
ncbi:MAG TPA: stage V sporulation protein B [Clostridiales bacterium]|nr:stage V sporulation protein B [Clostridiales bacterium]